MKCNQTPECETATCETAACETPEPQPTSCDTCGSDSCGADGDCRQRRGLSIRKGGLLEKLTQARNNQSACTECGQTEDCGCEATEAEPVQEVVETVPAVSEPIVSRSRSGLLARLRARRPAKSDCQCDEGTDCGCDDAAVVKMSFSDAAETTVVDGGCTDCAAGGVGGALRNRLMDNRVRVIDRARNAAGAVRGLGAGVGNGLGIGVPGRYWNSRGAGGIGCGRGGCGIGGLGLCPTCRGNFAATVGGEIPHTALNPYGPGAGPGQAPQYVYPYYTTRGPRDFLTCEPPSIGY